MNHVRKKHRPRIQQIRDDKEAVPAKAPIDNQLFHYRSRAGSVVRVYGRHQGMVAIEFAKNKEKACKKSEPRAEATNADDAWLLWTCSCHGTAQAKLFNTDEPRCENAQHNTLEF